MEMDKAEMERRAIEMCHQIVHPEAYEWKNHFPTGKRAGVYDARCPYCQPDTVDEAGK